MKKAVMLLILVIISWRVNASCRCLDCECEDYGCKKILIDYDCDECECLQCECD